MLMRHAWCATMIEAACTVMVFAKAPVPGNTKTRLIPVLGAGMATRLYELLLGRTLETAFNSAVGPLQLWCTPDPEHPVLRDAASRYSAELKIQQGNSLGTRMENAFCECLSAGGRGLLIGCDCPELCVRDLSCCASWLAEGVDAVLGPAEDGGYYLVGLAAEAPGLFADMAWGTPEVLDITRNRLRRMGLRWRELPRRWDVDRPEDLTRLHGVPAFHDSMHRL